MSQPAQDIAIVGMACLFPGAGDVTTYWQNILAKKEAFSEPPDGAHREAASAGDPDAVYCTRAGYLGDLSRFDPFEFGVMPKGIDGSEPEHFLALRVASEALEDAGYPDIPLNKEKTEVILGRGTYVNRALINLHLHGAVIEQTLDIIRDLRPDLDASVYKELKSRLHAKLPEFDPVAAAGVVSSITSGRIANRLDLHGANYCLDAACASSLIALQHGVEDLRSGKCDAALVGGVQLSANHLVMMVFSQLGALSRRSEIRPFDAEADGTLLGEGVGVVVLKRREDAERDGNRIYACIKGVGVASDGRAKSVVAPRVEGQELALRRAYEASGVSPKTVQLIEAHGTGIPLGDATEIESLIRVFGELDLPRRHCAIGSVKSLIGHLIPAAGIAGLMKAALALHHRVLPPSSSCDTEHPDLQLGESPFYVNVDARPWLHGVADTPRRAGVSAFGFGGINAHAVLEEYEAPAGRPLESKLEDWPVELFVIEAETRDALIGRVEAMRSLLEKAPEFKLKDLAYSLNTTLESRPARLCVVAASREELTAKLSHALDKLRDPARTRIKDRKGLFYFDSPLASEGKLAFVCPGEGSQYRGMLADLCMHFPEVRRSFDEIESAYVQLDSTGRLSHLLYPPPAAGESDSKTEDVWGMEVAVQAVTAASRAIRTLLKELKIEADAVVGHSSGEFTALEAAGVTAYESEEARREYLCAGIRSVRGVAEAETKLPQVHLLATGCDDPAKIIRAIDSVNGMMTLAMHNCPFQLVVSVPESKMKAALHRLHTIGATVSKLPFNRPYHTPAFEPACGPLKVFFDGLELRAPRVPLYSCATTEPFPADADGIRSLAVSQWTRPVRFQETIERMYADGVRLFVEVGPKGNLSSFIRSALGKRSFEAVPLNLENKSGLLQLQMGLGLLAAQGVTMDLEVLYRHRNPKRLDLDDVENWEVPRQRPKLTLELPRLELNEDDLAILPTPRTGANPVESTPSSTSIGNGGNPAHRSDAGPHPSAHAQVTSNASAIDAYARTMRQFMNVQRMALDAFGATQNGGDSAARAAEAGTSGARSLPLMGDIVEIDPGKSLRARRVLDASEDLFLRDHVLGGRISKYDPELRPLTVMPLAMSLEMLAEGALQLCPDSTVIALNDIRANHWVAMPHERLEVEIQATRIGPSTVQVQLCDVASESAFRRVFVEAIVELADAYPDAPRIEPEFELAGAQPSRFTKDVVYTTGMFNGPSFQAVRSVERWSPEGSVGILISPPREGLFRGTDTPSFAMDPVLLDAAGQLAAHWNAESSSSGFNFFPYRCEALQVFGPLPDSGLSFETRLRIHRTAQDTFSSDIDLVDENGRLYMRLVAWEDKAFDLPQAFYGMLHGQPDDHFSEAVQHPSGALFAEMEMECRRVDVFDKKLLLPHGGIWLNVLAFQVLSSRERDHWLHWEAPQERRLSWLLGRVAVKDAVRYLLRKREDLTLCPADIEIESEPSGRPIVRGPWSGRVSAVPVVSLAHSGDVAVAVAVDGASGHGIGIDLERSRAIAPGTEHFAFTRDERRLLEKLPEELREEWTLRFWAAKEAAGKAAGRAREISAQELAVKSLDARRGEITLEWRTDSEKERTDRNISHFAAGTWRDGDYVMALSYEVGEEMYAELK